MKYNLKAPVKEEYDPILLSCSSIKGGKNYTTAGGQPKPLDWIQEYHVPMITWEQ